MVLCAEYPVFSLAIPVSKSLFTLAAYKDVHRGNEFMQSVHTSGKPSFRLVACVVVVLSILEGWAYLSFQKNEPAHRSHHCMEVREAQAWLECEKSVLVVDVRSRHEFSGSHVPGAINMPLFELYRRSGELPSERPLLIVDFAGARAIQAYKLLSRLRPDIAVLRYVKGGLISLPVYNVVSKRPSEELP